jgi:hypothetical protein
MAKGVATNCCCCCSGQARYASGGPTMTIKNLQNKIYLLYHGDPSMKGSIGYLESLLRGRGQFEDL